MDHRPSIRQGSIVWARVDDTRGNVKLRPLVVLTATAEIFLDEPFIAAAVTTTFADPPPPHHVELPWYIHGHPATRLRRRSAVVCNWLVSIRASDVQEVGGYVPSKTLLRIIDGVKPFTGPDPPEDAPHGPR